MESGKFIKSIMEVELEVCTQADSFLQSAMWGEFKSRFGWKSRAFLIEWAGMVSRPFLTLSRRLAPGISMAYVPWGPELPAGFPEDEMPQALAELVRKLKPFLSRNTAFVRFDPPWFMEEGSGSSLNDDAGRASAQLIHSSRQTTFRSYEPLLLSTGFKCAAATVQPPDTVLIDLRPPCEEILAAMKPKWRYNTALAGKKGVTVNAPDSQGLETFYLLLQETAGRDGIAIHNISYYQTLFEICAEKTGKDGDGPRLRLYTASHEGDMLAAIVVLLRGKYATYLYGASSSVKRNLMASYALQWRAMQDAKASGCQWYDLFGIPPNDDPNHPMAGLYRFKTGFGGRIIHRPGSWDYAYRPLVYGLFSAAEGARKKIRDQKKKKETPNDTNKMNENYAALLGKIGVTDTELRPSGTVLIGNEIYPAEAVDEAIEAGRGVRVTHIKGKKVIVKKV
jgi:lipid II:glycine glycyltransferase (peptidoglycan interpeptide bridge formation enzyme)